MPIHLQREAGDHVRETDTSCVDIGLVNNMPDTALDATKRQFVSLLAAAAGDIEVRLTLYSLPDIPRGDFGRHQVSTFYTGIDDLWHRRLDGLIVTGTEPRAANLMDEPYWGSLIRTLEWAEHNTHSTVWSCLAAHAAVLHLDGIARRPLPDKLFGLFKCAPVSDHHMTGDVPGRLHIPHSRWNDLPQDALTSCGYRVLTRSDDAGADMFVRQTKSLFVFFQGHPEYEAHTLLLEYRRDIGRFLRGERETYPAMPQGYFDHETDAALTALQHRALSDRREDVLADFPTALAAGRLTNTWRPAAARLYRNWLLYLCAQKDRALKTSAGQLESTRVEAV